jgi:hypothetical protein
MGRTLPVARASGVVRSVCSVVVSRQRRAGHGPGLGRASPRSRRRGEGAARGRRAGALCQVL